MKIKNLLTTALLLLGVSTASATITSGYYRIKNNAYEGRYIGENTLEHTLPTSTDISSTDYTYVWYLDVDGTNVTIKNAVTGRYVQRLNNLSEYYETNTTPATFTLEEPSTGVFTFTDTYNNGLHCSSSQSYYVVRWYTSDDHNKWIIESVEVDNDVLTTQQAAFAEASTSQLTTFFSTTACTELNDTYKSYSDDALRTAMSALPTSVQDLAVKVKNNSWGTYAGWEKTEKTFRIADYKAYSNSSRWTSIMGLKYQYAQLENPTGIYVSSGNYLQIYVGSIPTGETVKLAIAGYGAGGYGGTPIVTYTLHEGMNVMQVKNDGNCFVIYEVDNTTDGSTPYKLLSTYNDVTVHIEGGTVQGYFDLTKGDDNDDWTQLKANLMSENMFCMKTKTLTFNLQTGLIKTAVDGGGGEGSTGKMVEMLEYWQSIEDMEDEIFNRTAIADFTYCNNIHTVTTIGNEGDGELYAFTNGIYFSPEQHNRLFNNKLFREGNDNLWASAHELGHHRQEPINMAGNTEVSNNLYSNVAVYQQGHYTSRTASIQMTFDDFQESLSWPERVKNACDGVSNYNQQLLHLNWQLYQFFHINGNKTDFFPLLFSALRADPMVKTTGEDNLTLANNDYLKYYVKCCTVSGYDLTEFFEAYGFFKLPPVQGNSKTYNDVTTSYYTTFDDYGTYNLGVTQGMIDAAKAAVAALSLPKCNIIFIEDRVSAPDATYEGHSVGEKKLLNPDAPVSAFGEVGETGQYTTFGVTPSAYTYNVNTRGYVTMSGTGAVGFKLYDNTGNLIGLYNTNTFKLPAGAYDAEGLTTGYSIKAAGGSGTDVTPTRDNSIEVQVDVKDVNAMAENADDALSKGNQITNGASLVSGKSYLLYYSGSNNSGFVKAKDSYFQANYGDENPTFESVFKFISNEDVTPTYKIKSNWRDTYFPVPTKSTTFTPTTEGSAGSWALNFQSGGNIAPSCSGYSINRSTLSGTTRVIHGWDSGTAAANQLKIYEIDLSSTPLEEINDKLMSVANEPAAMLETGQWYVMFDRGANHGYLYENSSSHTLYNTSTVPGDYAPLNAQYLVRIVGENEHYYLQTGYGNYFGEIIHNTAVQITALREHPISLKKILRNDGHYYLNSEAGVILDANVCNAGDGTVVGWGSTIPTTTGGNNDWAFYPVTLPNNHIYSFLPSDVEVFQGHQTTGVGNTAQALLRVKVTPFKACRATNINITLSGIEQLEHVAVYTTTSDQLRASGASPMKISADITPTASLNIPVTMPDMTAGETIYFWITADIKSSATEWETVDAAISSITYTNDYIEENSLERMVCNIAEKGNPDGAMRIYKSQTTLWTSSQSNPTYYRIPALLKTGTNTLLAFTDYRYDSTEDLGKPASGHKIDVVMRKSTDGGATWGDQILVAAGDGSTAAGFGYGDPAVALAANGDIICLMAAGQNSWSTGMKHIGFTKSSDGGETWNSPIDIYDIEKAAGTYLTNPHYSDFTSVFVSSGHGITQTIANKNRIAFPALGKVSGTTNEYVIYSDDNGATWTFTNNYGYTGADESKLLELNDGKLLMSIRTGSFNSSANRGYNRTTDTNVENWGSQGQWSDLYANGCNSDLIYYNRSTEDASRPDVMLHSVVKSYSNNHRKDLRLYISVDQGETWKEGFVLQPGWAAYSSMQVLDNGDLAILFEDGSIGNEDKGDCFDINYVIISRQLLGAKIDEILDAIDEEDPETAVIKVVYGTTDEKTYGSWSDGTWTSTATQNPVAGLTLTKSAGSFDKYSSLNSNYNLAYKVSAANTNQTLTLTAPTGYVITGYSLQAVNGGTGAYTYTLTAAAGTPSITTTSANNSSYKNLNVNGLSASSTTITVNGTSTDWLAIANFTVRIAKSGITETNVKVTNNDNTSYGSITSNVWTSAAESGLAGVQLTSKDLTLTTPTAFSKKVLGLQVASGSGDSGTLTMTVPDGYLISEYEIEAHNWSSGNSFTLTPVEGTGSPVTVTNYAEGSTTAMSVSNVNSNFAHLTVSATTQTNPLCFRKFIITVYNTLKDSKTITYAIVDNAGNVVTRVEDVSTYIGYAPLLPTSSIDKRPWCNYEEDLYKDAACTEPLTKIRSYTTTAYSRFNYDGPFEFSTDENPKWYLIYSRKKNEPSTNYFAYKSVTAFNTTTNGNTPSLYDDTEYHWAFIGNPYSLKLKNRNGGYLSAAATVAGSNGAAVSSKITDGEDGFSYTAYSLYGFTNNDITNTTTPFALALNGSNKKTWVDGADVHRLLYHGNITVNSDLKISNWNSANWEAIEVPETYDVTLNTVGDASYATLYLPFDVQTDGDTRAYYITTANDGYARLTEVDNNEIAAQTAVVLVNEVSNAATFNIASGLSQQVAEEDNLLKGTLTSMELNLGDETPYYSLGRKDGKIGFYKFNNSGTTTITLGANKAYLDTTAPTPVKGFLLGFDDATAVRLSPDTSSESEGNIYNLAGQRMSKLQKGVNIMNGKKVLVK